MGERYGNETEKGKIRKTDDVTYTIQPKINSSLSLKHSRLFWLKFVDFGNLLECFEKQIKVI